MNISMTKKKHWCVIFPQSLVKHFINCNNGNQQLEFWCIHKTGYDIVWFKIVNAKGTEGNILNVYSIFCDIRVIIN